MVLLGAGEFKLTRRQGDETIVIKSNVTLRGQGYATHLYFDPTTPPSPLRYYPVRIGTALARLTTERDAKAAPLYDLYMKALGVYTAELTN